MSNYYYRRSHKPTPGGRQQGPAISLLAFALCVGGEVVESCTGDKPFGESCRDLAHRKKLSPPAAVEVWVETEFYRAKLGDHTVKPIRRFEL